MGAKQKTGERNVFSKGIREHTKRRQKEEEGEPCTCNCYGETGTEVRTWRRMERKKPSPGLPQRTVGEGHKKR